jgi:hypothetical protein
MRTKRWLRIIADMLAELGYPADHVAATLKALDERPLPGGKHLLTTKQICDLMGISRTTLWRMQLPSLTVGRCKRYDMDLVMAALAHDVSDRPVKPRAADATRNIKDTQNG